MIEDFIKILTHPEETTKKILKEDYSWGKIITVLLIIAVISSIAGAISLLANPQMMQYPFAGAFMTVVMFIFGIPASIGIAILGFLIIHAVALIMGKKGDFRKLSSVLSFVSIITLISVIAGAVNAFFMQSNMNAMMASGDILSIYTTPSYLITLILGFIVSAIYAYYAHYPIKQVYGFTKSKSLIVAYIPFVLSLILTAISIVFIIFISRFAL
jgi:hypothetical protein